MATINGTNNADTVYGTSSADTINGLRGDDTLVGGGGADRLDGGGGYDTIFYFDSTVGVGVNLATGRGVGGTAEGDTFVSIEAVWGSSHNDTITGRDDADELLYGLDGNDVLKGGGGADGLDGGAGNDILKGGGGADTLTGGSGSDTADYSQAASMPHPYGWDGVIVNLITGVGSGGEADGDRYSSIEHVTGSQYNDLIYGNEGANVLKGLGGLNYLYGFGGDDVLEGGADYDRLDGGTGNDRMAGGGGTDVYFVDSVADVIIEAVGQGNNDQLTSTATYALPPDAEVEGMYMLNLNATVAMDFAGNDYAQYISGNAGVNVLSGNGGADQLVGHGGDDHLFGGEGDDRLTGSFGADVMYGGNGADRFVYAYTFEANQGADTIGDFSAAQGDRIDVSGVDANRQADGYQDFTFIGTAAFTAPGQISATNDGLDTYLLLNDDSDAAADGVIRVNGLHVVDAGWFLF